MTTNTATIEANVLKQSLKAVAGNMAKDSTRVHLHAVRFEFHSDKLRLVATDGHTLTIADVPTSAVAELGDAVLIQSDDIKAIIKMIGKNGSVGIEQSAGTITFTHEGSQRCCVLVESAAFPPYEGILPKSESKYVEHKPDTSITPIPLVGMNPLYLARMGKACSDFAGTRNMPKGVAMQIGAGLVPVQFDFKCEIGTLLVVIMPMRI